MEDLKSLVARVQMAFYCIQGFVLTRNGHSIRAPFSRCDKETALIISIVVAASFAQHSGSRFSSIALNKSIPPRMCFATCSSNFGIGSGLPIPAVDIGTHERALASG